MIKLKIDDIIVDVKQIIKKIISIPLFIFQLKPMSI